MRSDGQPKGTYRWNPGLVKGEFLRELIINSERQKPRVG